MSQKPSTLKALETPVILPAVAAIVHPNPPRSMMRFPNVAVPVESVAWVNGCLPTDGHGGVPFGPRVTFMFGSGVLVLSVTRTCTGEPVRTWPSMEFCGCLTKMTFAGGAAGGAIVME